MNHLTSFSRRLTVAATACCVLLLTVSSSLAADPTPEQVIAKALEAIGGRAALDRANSLQVVTEMTNSGMNIRMESSWSRSGGRRSIVSASFIAPPEQKQAEMLPPTTETIMVTDGNLSWMKSPIGYSLLSDVQKQALKEQAGSLIEMIDAEKHWVPTLTSIVNTGKVGFEGRPCWKLHYIEADGDEGDVYYDVATHLPAGFESIKMNKGKPIPTRGVLSDWQPEKGVKFFRSMTITSPDMPGQTMTVRTTLVSINTIDESIFAAPDEVKKLAAAQSATGAAGAEIKFEDLTPSQQQMASSTIQAMKQSGSVEAMKQAIRQIEPYLGMMPPEQQLPMRYTVQELKKEIAKLGG